MNGPRNGGGGGGYQGGQQPSGPPGGGGRYPQPQPQTQAPSVPEFVTQAQQIVTEIYTNLVETTTAQLVPETVRVTDETTTTTTMAAVINNTTSHYSNISLPAPCYELGRPSMVAEFFGVSFVIPVLALLYLIYEIIKRKIRKKLRARANYEKLGEYDDDDEDAAPRAHDDKIREILLAKQNQSAFMNWAKDAASFQTLRGQYMLATALLCAFVSFMIYLIPASQDLKSLEICGTMPNGLQLLDFIANLFLLFYYCIRLIGNEKKMKILVDAYSWVDYFCIPTVLAGCFMNRYFTGFSFVRSYNFLWLVDLLVNRGVFRTVNTIKLTYLVLLVISTLLIAAGILHLAENIGDFYPIVDHGVYDGQRVSFWRCFLYLYGKLTLIDLSGIRVQTTVGKMVIYAFQLIALGIIGRTIPQIMALLRITPEYEKEYFAPERFLHIIISGHVTASSVAAFLGEFYHPDRDISENFKIVILGDTPPDESMDRLMKQYFNRADYRKGSILSLRDLNRVKLMEAAAILLVANKAAPESDGEDAVNIMKVVSIKNFKDDARVIVQLLQYHNKAYLQNIPSWNIDAGDIVICIAELRLGLLAQSCYAPGFSTLIANFFTTRSFNEKKKTSDPWMLDYARGTSLEMYARPMSDAFSGMTFTQACEFCYLRLKIVLVAVKTDPHNLSTMPFVNPGPDCILGIGTVGYFIADSTEEVDRATFYCAVCHRDLDDPVMIMKCSCNEDAPSGPDDALLKLVSARKPTEMVVPGAHREPVVLEGKIWSFIRRYPNTPARSVADYNPDNVGPQLDTIQTSETVTSARVYPESQYDHTGMFHWCPGRPIESVLLTRQQAAQREFSGHIVVCILSQPNSQIVGLHSFVLPLRSSVIKPEEVKDIIILSDHSFMRKEWNYLYNLPRVYIVKGTALNRADLRAVTLNTCKMCVILGAPSTGAQMQGMDDALIDRSVILATLNVRAMRFSEDEAIPVQSSRPPSDFGSISETDSMYQQRVRLRTRARQTGYEVPVVTDLLRDTNAQFLDQDDDDLPGTEFYMTQPYACGRAFSGTVLDLLMITSFFNPVIVNVFRTMIFGGASLELEKILAEGAGLIGGTGISKSPQLKSQVIVNQFSISSGPLSVHAESTYGGLFIDALVSFGRLCLGVYRKMDPTDDNFRSAKRFVIANPPEDFILDPTDLIFSLERPEEALPPPDPRKGLQAFLSKP